MAGEKMKEIQRKAAHLERLRAAKAKRSIDPLLERAQPSREEKQTILIVCEGKNTEPSYFNQFRLTSAIVKALGKGYNTLSLVKETSCLQEKYNYDQVWCVFDMDSNSPQNFNAAITLAEQLGFKVGYSNQAFEYWLLLHFEDHQGGPMNRSDYNDKINKYINPLGAIYDGHSNKEVTDKFFNLLMGMDPFTQKRRVGLAIKRAKRNYKLFNHRSPALEESSTTVYELVKEILKYV